MPTITNTRKRRTTLRRDPFPKVDELAHSDEIEAQRAAIEEEDEELVRRQSRRDEEDEDYHQSSQSSEPWSSSQPTVTNDKEDKADEAHDEDVDDEEPQDEGADDEEPQDEDTEDTEDDSDHEPDYVPEQPSSPRTVSGVVMDCTQPDRQYDDETFPQWPHGL